MVLKFCQKKHTCTDINNVNVVLLEKHYNNIFWKKRKHNKLLLKNMT